MPDQPVSGGSLDVRQGRARPSAKKARARIRQIEAAIAAEERRATPSAEKIAGWRRSLGLYRYYAGEGTV